MRAPSIEQVLAALKTHTASEIATAICAAGDVDVIERLTDALVEASTHLATYPPDRVIAEADALLYETLRSPVADALPPGAVAPVAAQVARHLDITEAAAASLLVRIRDTDADAARALVASGVEPNWTLEQQQVWTCIRELLAADTAPTRARVVAHATQHARHAMRTHDGAEPFVAATDLSLPPRILSPSPMALVPAWMARLDACPPVIGLAADRLAYLRAATTTMGRASTAAAAVHHLTRQPQRTVMTLAG